MKTRWIGAAAVCLLAASPAAQTSSIITTQHESHHRLSLWNGPVKVFEVEVAPGDSILWHRPDQGTVAIAIGEQEVTLGLAGKFDVPQRNAGA